MMTAPAPVAGSARRSLAVLGLLVLGCHAAFPGIAQAQLFRMRLSSEVQDKNKNYTRQVEAFFEEAEGVDPTQVEEVLHTKLWVLTPGRAPTQIPFHLDHNPQRTRDRLVAEVQTNRQAVAARGECVYGVTIREAPILLRYYPKTVAGDPEQLNTLGRFSDAPLEIVPRFHFYSGRIEFTALVEGKPAQDVELVLVDREHEAHGTKKEKIFVTGRDGTAVWNTPPDGEFTVYLRREYRARTKADYLGMRYDAIQDVATLTFTLPLRDTGPQALLYKVAQATQNNLLGPLVLFFFLGLVARIVRSDLRFPVEGYQLIVIFLLLSIGYEGGHQLKAEPNLLGAFIPMGTGFVVNTLVSLVAVLLLNKVLRFDVPNSCALGALYGSDSAGLFAVAFALVKSLHLPFQGFMPALLAVMEIPGVLVGIVMYRMMSAHPHSAGDHEGRRQHGLVQTFLHELKSPGVFMLIGGMVVGYFTVNPGYMKTEPFFINPFTGVMCLFLFENGLKAGEQLASLKKGALKLVLFGSLFPLAAGLLAVGLARLMQLDSGSAVLFAVLVAAPSNIAAPAAMRLAIPEANPSIYFTTGLAISFPTLVVLGVPLFYIATQLVY